MKSEESTEGINENLSFNDFIEQLTDCELPQLPINHIINVSYLDSLYTAKEIKRDYLRDKCEVFGEHLIYFFYGRPSFRLSGNDAFPVCFVFKRFPCNPYKVFPFDSGAFFQGRMAKYFESEQFNLEDFEIASNYQTIFKVINFFFENNANYYDGIVRRLVDGETNYYINAFLTMIRDNDTDHLDQRKSSIELIFNENVKLNNNNLELIVIPETDFVQSGTVIDFTEIIELLRKELNCYVMSYDIQTKDPVKSSYIQINRLVKRHIQSLL